MSVVHCDTCDKWIDTDFNAEHFMEGTEVCGVNDQSTCEDCGKGTGTYNVLKNAYSPSRSKWCAECFEKRCVAVTTRISFSDETVYLADLSTQEGRELYRNDK